MACLPQKSDFHLSACVPSTNLRQSRAPAAGGKSPEPAEVLGASATCSTTKAEFACSNSAVVSKNLSPAVQQAKDL